MNRYPRRSLAIALLVLYFALIMLMRPTPVQAAFYMRFPASHKHAVRAVAPAATTTAIRANPHMFVFYEVRGSHIVR